MTENFLFSEVPEMIFASETMNLNIKDAVGYLTFKKLEECHYINHALSTRLGGVSKNEFKSMNLGFKCNDIKTNVFENYQIFCNAAGFNYNSLVASHQSHTCNVRVVGRKDAGIGILKPQNMFDIDALITNEVGVTLVTFHADCVPIFFVDSVKMVIALAHAGWRGTVNGIATEVLRLMYGKYGCNADDIICAVGPAIGGCCFEVGEDVYEKFRSLKLSNIDKIAYKDSEDRYKVDILQANKQLLISEGIKESNISVSDLCTRCCHDLLISHRATNGKRGTMAAMLCLKNNVQ